MYQVTTESVLKESVSKRGNRKKDATSPGWKKTGTSTPRLTWLRIFRGKAQPSRDVSSPKLIDFFPFYVFFPIQIMILRRFGADCFDANIS